MSASPNLAHHPRVPVARDIMQRSLITLSPDDSFFSAIRTFLRNRISGAPVLDADGKLLGMCSELDCLKVLANGEYYRDDHQEEGTVSSMMRTDYEWVPPHTDVYTLAQLFVAHNVRRLPVIENGELIGQLSRRDVLRAMEKFGASRVARRRYPDYREPAGDVGPRRS
jgi:CBS domain-containing protein